MTFTNAEKAAEAERELKKRAEVYPRLPSRIRPLLNRQMAIMEEIFEDYKKLDDKEKLI